MIKENSTERSRNYLQQLKGAVIYRAVAITASFIAIPLMINYLGQEQFGIWSTLLSVMSWVIFFELGIGNGMRNKVAEYLAKDEKAKAVNYISSGYALIGLIGLFLWVVITTISYFVPWQGVFNTIKISEDTLGNTFRIVTFFVVLNFWLGLISSLLSALQKTSLIALGQLITNLLVLTFVFVLSKFTSASIINLAFAYGLSITSANLLLSIWFFRTNPELLSTLCIDKQHISPLLAIGLQFFIIQFAVLIIFSTDKILITQLFGPSFVTEYEVVFKLFSVITLAHGLISTPLWSAYTDAYHRSDFKWIRQMLNKQLIIFMGIFCAVIILCLSTKSILAIWIEGELDVSFSLIVLMGAFVLISSWNNIFAMLVNGIGKITLQLYTAVAAMVVNIPLSIFFGINTSLGISGIVLGTICSLVFASIALPLQVTQQINSLTKIQQNVSK
ncbi:oligosaccharide flippase family protein [Zooshikella harenae]|uniref:Oligosaccharide flippase family protein n=1 Tax=Zooshikella harenae TaxID=2827238 RepID=A0ABS5Z8J3_9GAMM|nr:oligosaccharide flippase family protein [Zooshikella harenae]MBU2710374.1 oligosaccharide flippase family protein [Zooshikella harenae]